MVCGGDWARFWREGKTNLRFDLTTTAKLDGMGLILRKETGVIIRNH